MSDSAAVPPAATGAVVMKKKKRRDRKDVRKRRQAMPTTDSDESDVEIGTAKKVVKRGLVASTKLPKVGQQAEESEFVRSKHEAQMDGPRDGGATMTTEIDTAHDKDAQALFDKQQRLNAELEDVNDNEYRGQTAYQQFNKIKDTVAGNAFKSGAGRGPQRAPLHIRSSVRWDYQPDICKDYKETGYCGFGDTCKFLHDRSDYKAGWEIDREIDQGRYNAVDVRQYQIEHSDSDSDDELPFACFICREPFKNPVVTPCNHYFCEKCLLAHFRKSKKCYVCSEPTNGVFRPARDIIAKQKEQAQAQAQDDGNGASDDEDSSGGGILVQPNE